MNPYIGITDFMTFAQVKAMLEVFRQYSNRTSYHVLHVGVMTSYKVLYGKPTKWKDAFPKKEDWMGIFSSKDVFNCLHYADYEGQPNLLHTLEYLIKLSGENLHAIQLDMIWPSANDVEVAFARNPHLDLILQIGKNAIEEVGETPSGVVRRLRRYEDAVSRVLLDKSMGRGIGMDAHGLIPYIEEIKSAFPHIIVGVAGGLGPNTIELVRPIVDVYPDISIDAQGQLRPSKSALDPVDWDMAAEYLQKALEMFSGL